MAVSDMRQFFEARRLDERLLGQLEFVFTSPAYEEGVKVYIESVRDSMQRLSRDRTTTRKDKYPDDYLAGGMDALDGLLAFVNAILLEPSAERIEEAMSNMTPEKQYEMRRQAGQVRPVVGVDQDPAPRKYDPAEDI